MNELDHGAGRGTPKTYVIGFALSLEFTLAAYLSVWRHEHSHHVVFSHQYLYAVVLSLAVMQLIVQLIFFLHLGRESKPRWNLVVFSFMAMVLLILVLGSLWIMYSLNYHHDHRTPGQINNYIIKDEGIH